MMGTIIFTHIPKTAGTSLKKSVIFPNTSRRDLYLVSGVRRLIQDRPRGAKVVFGHFPYGAHRVLGRGPFHYLTVLRDPVDRAVSFYNYVLMCAHGNPGHRDRQTGHPALPDAERYPIDEFFELERYKNIQTKFTAGYIWDRPRSALHRWARGLVAPDSRLLQRAQYNLVQRYWYYGLLERIGEAQDIVAQALGGVNTGVRDVTRQTSGREKRVEPTPEQRARIRDSNALDAALYDFAVEHYNRQVVAPL